MKKILLIIISLFFVSHFSFAGNLPILKDGQRYEDPLYPSSNLTIYIYKAFSEPYSIEWVETYVDSEIIPTFLMYHEKEVSSLLEEEIIGVILLHKESYTISKIDFKNGVRIEVLWRKSDEKRYVMFSFKKTKYE